MSRPAPRFALSTHLYHGEPLGPAHLAAIAAAGFDAIEVFATRTHFDYADPRQVDALAGWLTGAGLRAVSMHGPITTGFRDGQWGRAYSNASRQAGTRAEAVAELGLALAAARTLGCETLVVHVGLPEGQPIAADDNDARAAARSLEELAEAAAPAGVALALEVIPNALSTPAALREWLEGDLDLGPTGVCLDLGHAHLVDGVADAAETLAGHVLTTHVHDNDGRADSHLVPFEGSIDWPAALMAFEKVGYAGRFVFEVADHGDAAGALARTVGARRRLQAILDDLAAPPGFV